MVATYHMRLVIMRQLLACPEIQADLQDEVNSLSLSGTALIFDYLRYALLHQYELLSLGRKNSPYFSFRGGFPPASGYVT